MIRHILLPLFFFPAVIFCIAAGGAYPLFYIAFSVSFYLVFDRVSLRSIPKQNRLRRIINNSSLLLQLPLSLILLLVLFSRVSPQAPINGFISNIFSFQTFEQLSFFEMIVSAFVVGFHLSTNYVVAHELMHRTNKIMKACSRMLLSIVGDAHFIEAHLYGHHANVGTNKDPATARRGESFYRFLVRSTAGQWKEAFLHESKRLAKRNTHRLSLKNRVVRGNLTSTSLIILVGYFFSLAAALSYLLVIVIAKILLEAINYIQHYGLKREEGIRTNLTHSWESDGLGSSLILFNLTRHAQHHLRPLVTCDDLEHSSSSPQINGGYIKTIMLCLFPKLWFATIHPVLDEYLNRRTSQMPKAAGE